MRNRIERVKNGLAHTVVTLVVVVVVALLVVLVVQNPEAALFVSACLAVGWILTWAFDRCGFL